MFSWIKDWLLKKLQQDCSHPGDYVAVDIAEGQSMDTSIKYCRRCGAVKVVVETNSYITMLDRHEINPPWRMPDPFLWRDYDPQNQDEKGRML